MEAVDGFFIVPGHAGDPPIGPTDAARTSSAWVLAGVATTDINVDHFPVVSAPETASGAEGTLTLVSQCEVIQRKPKR